MINIEQERNWPEDFNHENGNYQNKCCCCDNLFMGHKRRPICKKCMGDDISLEDAKIIQKNGYKIKHTSFFDDEYVVTQHEKFQDECGYHIDENEFWDLLKSPEKISNALSNNNLLVIGDVHGKIKQYNEIISKHNGCSIQVGDFGFDIEHEWFLSNVDYDNHKVVFGNHDDYSFLNSPHSLSNYSYDPINGLMTVRGAFSIDRHRRTENKDWWANEELNYAEMQEAIDFYVTNRPKIMITHDCPHDIRNMMWGINDKSITSNGLQFMMESHQPDLWIFGHHHNPIDEVINGIRFICLGELETIII
jgi:predicted phosphodiesterase